jgi:hypothetical protein
VLRMKLFRQQNPLADQLRASSCIFRLYVPGGVQPSQDLVHECERAGARLSEETAEDGARTLTLTVSHAVMDAFGGMFLISQLGAALCAQAAAACGPLPKDGLQRIGVAEGYRSVHFVCEAPRGAVARAREAPAEAERQTLTQRVLARFAGLGPFSGGRIAVVVAKDDLRSLDLETYRGNSLVMIGFAAEELGAHAAGSKARWRSVVAERSNRVAAVAMRRPGRLGASDSPVTVSSVGDVERLPWATALDPAFFEMIPTPGSGYSATVVLWGRGARQALTLCGLDDHPIMRGRDELCAAWKDALFAGGD